MATTPSEGKISDALAIERTDVAHERTDLAYERTRMAADRTLMAWVRTSLSMIGFGFTILKFFQYLRESKAYSANVSSRGPQYLGFSLVALGTGLMLLAMVHQMIYLRRLAKASGQPFKPSLAIAAALTLLLLGLITLASLILRIG